MLRLIGYFFGIGTVLALVVAAGIGSTSARFEGPARLRGAGELRAAGDDARSRRRRRADGRIRPRAAALPADPGHSRPRQGGLPVGRGQELLHPSGHRSPSLVRAVVTNVQNIGSGRRPVGASTITQQVAKNFLLDSSQTYDRKIREMISILPHRAGLFEGPHPRALSQRDLLRIGLLRHRGRRADLFRQVGQRTDPRRGRLSGRAASRPVQLPSVPPYRARDRAAQLGHRPDGGQRLCRARRGAKAQATAARRHAAARRQLSLRRRVLHRGGASRTHQPLRRGRALWRRSVGAHDARSRSADEGAQGAAQRPDPLRHAARFPRTRRHDRHSGDWGVPLGAKPPACPTCRNGAGGGAGGRRRTGWNWSACSRSDRHRANSSRNARHFSGQADMEWALRHVVDGQRVKANSPAEVLDPGDVVYVEKKGDGAGWLLRQVPEGRRRHGGDGPAYGPRAGHGRRLLLLRNRSSTGRPRPSASRARPSSRSSTPPRSTMATRRPPWSTTGRSPSDRKPGLVAAQLWRRLCRPVDAARRHRAFAQPDDGAAGQRHGHAAGGRICRALRRL
jgi:penicillin-binding protein 1A